MLRIERIIAVVILGVMLTNILTWQSEAMDRKNVVENTLINSPTPSLTTTTAKENSSGNGYKKDQTPDTSCVLPYLNSSPWNQKILSTNYHPLSDEMTKSLGGSFGSNPNSYTYPVYEVDATTPVRQMSIRGNYSNVLLSGELSRVVGTDIDIPIPDNAQPSVGGDAQIVILNKITGDEWGFYETAKNSDGSWSATNGYHYNIALTGVAPAGFSSRGGGIPYLAGLIRKCEVVNGAINHAIAFGYDYACNQATCGAKGLPFYVYPATKSDGRGDSEYDLPEGSRLRLNPNATEEQIEMWCGSDPKINERTCRIVVKALQDYGMILVDNSGHPKIYVENNLTANWGTMLNERIPSKIPYSEFKIMNF